MDKYQEGRPSDAGEAVDATELVSANEGLAAERTEEHSAVPAEGSPEAAESLGELQTQYVEESDVPAEGGEGALSHVSETADPETETAAEEPALADEPAETAEATESDAPDENTEEAEPTDPTACQPAADAPDENTEEAEPTDPTACQPGTGPDENTEAVESEEQTTRQPGTGPDPGTGTAADAKEDGKESKSAQRRSVTSVLVSVVLVVLCILLVPILACNITLIIKGSLNTETPPDIFGTAPLAVVDTDDMEGTAEGCYPDGALIFIDLITEEEKQALEVGDVVCFRWQNTQTGETNFVTYRIRSIERDEESGAITSVSVLGDNMTEEESSPVPVPVEDIVGVFKSSIPGLGAFAIFLQTPIGVLIFVGIPVVAYVVYDIIRVTLHNRRVRELEKAELTAKEEELARLRALVEEKAALDAETAALLKSLEDVKPLEPLTPEEAAVGETTEATEEAYEPLPEELAENAEAVESTDPTAYEPLVPEELTENTEVGEAIEQTARLPGTGEPLAPEALNENEELIEPKE